MAVEERAVEDDGSEEMVFFIEGTKQKWSDQGSNHPNKNGKRRSIILFKETNG